MRSRGLLGAVAGTPSRCGATLPQSREARLGRPTSSSHFYKTAVAPGPYHDVEEDPWRLSTGVPVGASAIIPRLVCRDVQAELDFYCQTFGAVEGVRRPGPDGNVAHAMLLFGPAMLMLEAEWPTLPSRAPSTDGSSPVVIYVYVADVDATVSRALAHGATLVVPVQTQFWGDRTGWVRDRAGHMWTIATRIEETSEDQRRERWSTIMDKKD